MIRHRLLLSAFCLAFCALASAQTTTEFPVVDKSDVNGVLQFSGTVTSVEQMVGNQLRSSCGVKAQAKNTSGKQVLLLIVSLDVRAPLGGCNDHHVFQIDNFFSKDAIPPDGNVTLANTNPGTASTESGPHNPIQQPEEPKADAQLLFVEYADGTTAGDDSAAQSILKTRSLLLQRLHALMDAYSSGGEDALANALDEKVDNSDVQWQITRLRDAKKSLGTAGVVARLKYMLQAADAHKAAHTAANQ